MDVCFCIGTNSGKVINSISKLDDNIKYFTYDNIKLLVKDAKLRHLEFKRIVLSSAVIGSADSDFSELNKFLREFGINTEVVLIINEETGADYAKHFLKYFNAPMYTLMVMSKGTTKVLMESVSDDILSLSTKYFDPFKNKILGKNLDFSESDSTGEQDSNYEGVPDFQSGQGFSAGPASLYSGYRGNSGNNWGETEKEYAENSYENSDAESTAEEDELSIGDLGATHSDTGFLDDEENEEINQHSKESEPQVVEEDTDRSVRERFESGVISSVTNRYKQEQVISTDLNIDLVISGGSHRATQDIIDEALTIYQKDSGKILIIDLDTTSNRLLSLIDIDKYYSNNCMEGISKQRVYVEDHVGICSNGYGVPVSVVSLKALLASKLVKKFDMVMIDCPLDCLEVIDEEVVKMCHVLVYSGGDMSSLTEMSIGLTNRSKVRLNVEKYIMRNCVVEIKGNLEVNELNYLRSHSVFANSSWLDRIS